MQSKFVKIDGVLVTNTEPLRRETHLQLTSENADAPETRLTAQQLSGDAAFYPCHGPIVHDTIG